MLTLLAYLALGLGTFAVLIALTFALGDGRNA